MSKKDNSLNWIFDSVRDGLIEGATTGHDRIARCAAISSLLLRAVNTGGTLFRRMCFWSFSGEGIDEFIDDIVAIVGGDVILNFIDGKLDSAGVRTLDIVWSDGLVHVAIDLLGADDFELRIDISSLSEDMIDKVIDICKQYVIPEEEYLSRAAMINKGCENNLSIRTMSNVGTVLERGNYTKSQLIDFDRLVKTLGADEVPGRLCLLNGETGSGKTYFIRGLMNELKNVQFILFPPVFVSELTSPVFVSLLNDIRLHLEVNVENMKVVFVIEDADQCLIPREVDNIASISTLLNFCDGIMGALFDFRVIATTNAPNIDIDKALLRPGRLLKQVEFDKLSITHATSILNRLVSDKINVEAYDGRLTLAHVYERAREMRWVPEKANKKPILKRRKRLKKAYRFEDL